MRQLKIRSLLTNDLERVTQLHNANVPTFPFPDLLNHLYCCNKVVEDEEGNIIGVGIVRLTSETILILDKSRERTTRSRAVQMLFEKMRREVKAMGMDETHMWVGKENASFKTLLCKHFGFVPCRDRSLFLQF
jgi:hypothetical protein